MRSAKKVVDCKIVVACTCYFIKQMLANSIQRSWQRTKGEIPQSCIPSNMIFIEFFPGLRTNGNYLIWSRAILVHCTRAHE